VSCNVVGFNPPATFCARVCDEYLANEREYELFQCEYVHGYGAHEKLRNAYADDVYRCV